MRWLGLSLGVALVLSACARAPEPPPALGTLERNRVELTAPTSEVLRDVLVRKGQDVVAGEIIAQLDGRHLRARLGEIDASAGVARAALARLLRGTRPEQIDEAQARRRSIASNLEQARDDFERISKLVQQGAESQARLDRAQARRRQLEADLRGARASLERLMNGATAEELDQARARIDEIDARRLDLEISIEDLVIKAPRAGRIDALPYQPGERPPAGAILAVMLAGDAYARVYVPAALRSNIDVSSSAWVTLEGSRQTVAGRVRMISAEAAFTPYYALTERDRGRLAYLAEIEFDPAAAAALPTGVPVEARFDGPPPNADGSRP